MRILPGVIAMAIIVVASNILVQFLLLDGLLTWGAFTYPFAFLVTDIMNRVYGPASARRVILAGFVVGIVCSLIGSQIMLEGDGYTYAAVAFRVAIGSATALITPPFPAASRPSKSTTTFLPRSRGVSQRPRRISSRLSSR